MAVGGAPEIPEERDDGPIERAEAHEPEEPREAGEAAEAAPAGETDASAEIAEVVEAIETTAGGDSLDTVEDVAAEIAAAADEDDPEAAGVVPIRLTLEEDGSSITVYRRSIDPTERRYLRRDCFE